MMANESGDADNMTSLGGAVGGADLNPSRDMMSTHHQDGDLVMRSHHGATPKAQVNMNEGVVNMANQMSTTHNLYYHKPSFTNVNTTKVTNTNVVAKDTSGYAQIKDQSDAEIHSDTDLFTPTSGYQQAIEMMEDTGLLLITGPSGCGKTTLARALLRHFQSQGRTPLVLHRCEEFRQHVGGDRKQVVMIDDAFGTEEFINSSFISWLKAFTTLRAFAREKKCFSVISCGKNILSGLEMKYNHEEIFQNFRVLDMETLAPFTDAEKKELLRRHLEIHGKPLHQSVFEEIMAVDSSKHMFPKCCKEFSQRKVSDICLHGIFKADDALPTQGQTATCDAETLTDQLINATQAADADHICNLLRRGVSADSEDDYGNLPLHIASKCGYDRVVRILLASGSHIDAADACNQMTALHYASSYGRHDVVLTLLEEGAAADAEDKDGWTPLQFACSKGFTSITETLLQNKADVNKPNKSGQTALHLASASGQVHAVNSLLNSAADLNVKDKDGESALHIACKYGHKSVAKSLVDKGANKEATDEYYKTPLHVACEEDQGDTIQFLLDEGANIEATNCYSNTPLHLACYRNNPATVKVLLQNNASVNAPNLMDWTALLIASRHGFEELVIILINDGADVNAQISLGITALHFAVSQGHADIAKILMEHGADLELTDADGWTSLHRACAAGYTTIAAALLDHFAQMNTNGTVDHKTSYLSSEGRHVMATRELVTEETDRFETENKSQNQFSDNELVSNTSSSLQVYIDTRDEKGQSPLHLACIYNHLNTAELLVQRGANKEAKDKHDRTPFHAACEEGHMEIIQFLVEQGANTEAIAYSANTPLHLACDQNHRAIASFLLQNKASVNTRSDTGWTPLALASVNGFEELADMLICQGADVNAQGANGWTSLNIAVSQGHTSTAMKLIEGGAHVGLATTDGCTPLHTSCAEGHTATAAALLDHHAQINKRNKKGRTALHLACATGRVETVQMLINRGADTNATDDDGYTAHGLSKRCDHFELSDMLSEIRIANRNACKLS